jgi:hypothetical protein
LSITYRLVVAAVAVPEAVAEVAVVAEQIRRLLLLKALLIQ